MANSTNMELLNKTIYSVFVRNYSEKGTFSEVTKDLERIKDIGTDIIWLLPIYPIGVKDRKGSVGSPYAIRDYNSIDIEQGTYEELNELIENTHLLGMKIIVDVVFNHTSPDSELYKLNKDFFLKDKKGRPKRKEKSWSDIIDLDYSNKELYKYQLDSLSKLVELGFDGFRCDVASLVENDFWNHARAHFERLGKELIWLGESTHISFVNKLKAKGYRAFTDNELYENFDILYDYDIHHVFNKFIKNTKYLQEYIDAINTQDHVYPYNYIKLRFTENHDQERLSKNVKDEYIFKNIMNLIFTLRGTNLYYNGQETDDENTPSLFEHDPIDLEKINNKKLRMLKLYAKVKKGIPINARYNLMTVNKSTAVMSIIANDFTLLSASNFSKHQKPVEIKTNLADGRYTNLISLETVQVKDSSITTNDFPLLLVDEKGSKF
jgi:glycosidase